MGKKRKEIRTSSRVITRYSRALMVFLVVTATAAVYGRIWTHDFVNFDDNVYIYKNPAIQYGLNAGSIRWAFTTGYAGNWHPVTWLAHMLDYRLFGADARGHHMVSLLLHILNSLLLFFIFKAMTGMVGRSGFVALLFALHPMHVESVAWAAERKDVLSAFFGMVTLAAYVRYARKPGAGRMGVVMALLTLGLMSKPMLVTMPFVLLLIDLWPLGRWRAAGEGKAAASGSPGRFRTLLVEKSPLFLLVAVSSTVTFIVQQKGGNVAGAESIALPVRLANALVAYLDYVIRLFRPSAMAALYPYPAAVSAWKAIAGGLVLLGVTIMAVGLIRNRSYLAVGWFWFLGTLVPVIGLVQVGNQYMADRYTYLPYVGLSVMIAWGVPDLLDRMKIRRDVSALLAAVAVAFWVPITWVQIGYWKNSVTLFEHILAVTEDNYLAHNNLGAALAEAGRIDEAVIHYQKAIRIKPDYETPYSNLGLARESQGRPDEAADLFEQALRLRPGYAPAHYNMARLLARRGRVSEAIARYRRALRLQPDHADSHYNLGNLLAENGRLAEAAVHFLAAIRIQPDFLKAYLNLGNVRGLQGRLDEAARQYRKALRIAPDYTDAHNNLGIALIRLGDIDAAIMHFRRAVALSPGYKEARANLARAVRYRQQMRKK